MAYSQMGLQMAITVGLGFWAGHWADRRWGISPWGMLAGLLLGAGIGLTVFIMEAMKLSKSENHREPEGKA